MSSLLSGQLLFAALATGGLYALVAFGLNLIYGTLRLLNVAHGEIVMLGAYAAYWAMTMMGGGPLLTLPFAALMLGAFGFALYGGLFRLALSRPALMKRIEGNSLLLFFGVSIILQNAVSLVFSASPRANKADDALIAFADVQTSQSRLMAVAITFLVCLALAIALKTSWAGRAVRAIIQNRDAAAIVGIPLDRLQAWSFAIGFAIAGLAGALVSLFEQISPFMGFPYTVAAFVVIILGGLGNLAGSLAAGLLLGVVETFGVAATSANWRSILVWGIFILVMLLKPQGLFGGSRR